MLSFGAAYVVYIIYPLFRGRGKFKGLSEILKACEYEFGKISIGKITSLNLQKR